MKLKPRNPIFAFLILIPLTALFAFILFSARNYTLNQRIGLRNDQRLAAVEKTIQGLEAELEEAQEQFRVREENQLRLMPVLLKEYMRNGRYTGPESFTDSGRIDGIVVRAVNNTVIMPETGSVLPVPDAGMVRDEVFLQNAGVLSGGPDTEELFLSSARISGDYYYIDITPVFEMTDLAADLTQMQETFEEIEESYGCRLLVLNAGSGQNDPDRTGAADEVWKYLVRPDVPERSVIADGLGDTEKLLAEKPSRVTIAGANFQVSFLDFSCFGEHADIVVLAPLENEYINIVNSVLLIIMLTLLITVSMIMWLYWTQSYVCRNVLEPRQVPSYEPFHLKELAISFSLIGAAAIFLIAICFQSLSNLNMETISDQKALGVLMDHLEEINVRESDYQENQEEWQAYMAERIAGLMAGKESLQTAESLAMISEMSGSDYVMLFNSSGEEIAASNGFIGFSISDTENLKAFQRVLSGLKTFISAPMKDPILEKDIQYIGTRIPAAGNAEPVYGMLMFAVDAQKSWQEADSRNIDDFLENSTSERDFVVVIDKESNKAVFSSQKDLIGESIPELRYEEEQPDSSDLDSFVINGRRYYGPYQSNHQYVCYYLTVDTYIRISSFLFSILSVLGYAGILLVITSYMLKPYSPEAFREAVKVRTERNPEEEDEAARGPESGNMIFRHVQTRLRIHKRRYWDDMLPEQKTGLFVRILLGIFVVLAFLFQIHSNIHSDRPTISFVLLGNWKRGMNLLGWSAAFIVVIAFSVFTFLKDILQRIFCSVHDPKILTIFRLFFSLVQYIAVILSIYLILGYLGLNSTMQLTSVSILSLAISLGSQSLVADILAGILIIFEGDFHVGDIIEVNGFSGVVQEIGVRSTKLLGLGDNIKIINNQSIKEVLNLSRMNAWMSLEYNIKSDQPLTEIEDMLKRELPELKNTIPEIVSGPYYKGIWKIGTAFGVTNYTLNITCECDTHMSRQVQRELNHAIILLFEKYNYELS